MWAGLQKLTRAGEAPRDERQLGAGSILGLKDWGEQAVPELWRAGPGGAAWLQEHWGGWVTPWRLSPPASELFWCPPPLDWAQLETREQGHSWCRYTEVSLLGPTQDREGQVGVYRPGKQNKQHRWWQLYAITGKTEEMSHVVCFLSNTYKFLKVIYFNWFVIKFTLMATWEWLYKD